jgi:hypothetical protein
MLLLLKLDELLLCFARRLYAWDSFLLTVTDDIRQYIVADLGTLLS